MLRIRRARDVPRNVSTRLRAGLRPALRLAGAAIGVADTPRHARACLRVTISYDKLICR